ncbi:MAG TPA: hypothetical protein VE646_02970 [Actinomycetota bacterium]|jgi:hypothetical protein|nr:hypothetical protein [Actinomycetota bacterium]
MKRFLPFALIGLIAILGLAFGMRAMRGRRGAEEPFEEMVSEGVS